MELIKKIRKIKKAREIEKQLIADVLQEVDDANINMEGVEEGNTANCAIVSINVIRTHNTILSPEYYIASSQKKAIKEYLNRSANLEDLYKRILTCCELRAIPQSNNSKFKLNEESIRFLNSLKMKLDA